MWGASAILRLTRVARRAVRIVVFWGVYGKNSGRWIGGLGSSLDGGGSGRRSGRRSINLIKSGLGRFKPFSNEKGIIEGAVLDVGIVGEKILSGVSV